jgi:hypothetical protein
MIGLGKLINQRRKGKRNPNETNTIDWEQILH